MLLLWDALELDSDFALKSREDFGSDRATPLSRDKTDDVALSGRGSLTLCDPLLSQSVRFEWILNDGLKYFNWFESFQNKENTFVEHG